METIIGDLSLQNAQCPLAGLVGGFHLLLHDGGQCIMGQPGPLAVHVGEEVEFLELVDQIVQYVALVLIQAAQLLEIPAFGGAQYGGVVVQHVQRQARTLHLLAYFGFPGVDLDHLFRKKIAEQDAALLQGFIFLQPEDRIGLARLHLPHFGQNDLQHRRDRRIAVDQQVVGHDDGQFRSDLQVVLITQRLGGSQAVNDLENVAAVQFFQKNRFAGNLECRQGFLQFRLILFAVGQHQFARRAVQGVVKNLLHLCQELLQFAGLLRVRAGVDLFDLVQEDQQRPPTGLLLDGHPLQPQVGLFHGHAGCGGTQCLFIPANQLRNFLPGLSRQLG